MFKDFVTDLQTLLNIQEGQLLPVVYRGNHQRFPPFLMRVHKQSVRPNLERTRLKKETRWLVLITCLFKYTDDL